MSPAIFLAIVQIVAALTPEAIKIVNGLVDAVHSSDLPEDELLIKLETLLGELKPMVPKI